MLAIVVYSLLSTTELLTVGVILLETPSVSVFQSTLYVGCQRILLQVQVG